MSVQAPELFSMYRGDDIAFGLNVTDEATGQAYDVTNWSIKVTMKLSPEEGDDAAAINKTFNALSGEDPSNGLIHILLSSEDTQHLLAGRYFFDVRRIANGLTSTIVHGRVRVIGTNPTNG